MILSSDFCLHLHVSGRHLYRNICSVHNAGAHRQHRHLVVWQRNRHLNKHHRGTTCHACGEVGGGRLAPTYNLIYYSDQSNTFLAVSNKVSGFMSCIWNAVFAFCCGVIVVRDFGKYQLGSNIWLTDLFIQSKCNYFFRIV